MGLDVVRLVELRKLQLDRVEERLQTVGAEDVGEVLERPGDALELDEGHVLGREALRALATGVAALVDTIVVVVEEELVVQDFGQHGHLALPTRVQHFLELGAYHA